MLLQFEFFVSTPTSTFACEGAGVYIAYMIEGSLEVKLPTIWTDFNKEGGRVREEKRREEKEEKEEKGQSQKQEDAGVRIGRKIASLSVFLMICGSGGSTSRLAKAAGAELSGRIRDEKLHAVVARSTCPSQNVQSVNSGVLLGIGMSKKCTPLWRELWRKAHFEVKMHKTHHSRGTF